MLIDGGRPFGAVRFRAIAAPMTTRACWGSLLPVSWRRQRGGDDRGLLADYPSVADSGNATCRRFCPTCGPHLFSQAEARFHLNFIRVVLDDPWLAARVASIGTAEAPRWAFIDLTIPSLPGPPPRGGHGGGGVQADRGPHSLKRWTWRPSYARPPTSLSLTGRGDPRRRLTQVTSATHSGAMIVLTRDGPASSAAAL
jgi:hypothetical protein